MKTGIKIKTRILYELWILTEYAMKFLVMILLLIGFVGLTFALSDESQMHTSATEISEDKIFAINIHQAAKFDNLELEFSKIEDSRCPSDVTCIWEGQAIIAFNIYDGIKYQTISFTTGKITTAYLGQYEIKLIGLEPYPASTKNISEKYVATISISKNNGENLPTPLKQISIGIPLEDVKCNDEKIPVYKYNRIRVACVTEDTRNALLQRGWALAKNEHSDISFSVITDKKDVADGPKLSTAIEIIDSGKYLVFHGYGWHGLHNVEITITNADEKITSIRSKTNENGVLYMPWLLPDGLSSGLYTIYATDGIHQNESTIPISMNTAGQFRYDSSELEVEVTGEKLVRRGTTHIIEIQVNRDQIPVDGAQVFISIEDYGEDIIREFNGRTNQQGHFVFSWEIPKKFDDIKTLLAFVDITDGISSKTELFKFNVYCLPGEKHCKVKGN